MSENTKKGGESLAFILGLISIPLSLILFGFISALGSFFLSWKSYSETRSWTLKNATAVVMALLGFFASAFMANSYHKMYLTWHSLQEEAMAAIGQHVQTLVLKDVDGRTVSLQDLQGKKVVVNFWATWCRPCEREMPTLIEMSENFRDNTVFLGISTEPSQDIIAFRDKKHITYPLVAASRQSLPTPFRVKVLPTTFLVDENGMITDVKVGAVSKKLLDKWLSPTAD